MNDQASILNDGRPDDMNALKVEQDATRCARCGYLLFGLADEQRCPECGFSVGASRQGPWLKFADPTWLRRLLIGAMIVMVTTTMLSIYYVAGYFFPTYLSNEYLSLCLAILFVLDLSGYWLLSEPDPSRVGEQGALGTRSALRISLFASFGVFLVSIVYQDVLQLGLNERYLLILVVGTLVSTITLFVRFSVIGMVSQRIPDARCARLASSMRVVYVISYAMFRVLGLLEFWWYLRFMRGATGFELPSWCRPFSGLIMFVVWLALVYLLVRFARILRSEYRGVMRRSNNSFSALAGDS